LRGISTCDRDIGCRFLEAGEVVGQERDGLSRWDLAGDQLMERRDVLESLGGASRFG
jgi:hypothetical protein